MNLGNVRMVLRPRDTLELLDLALRFVLSLDARAYARLALVTLVPALAGCAALRWVTGWEWMSVWLVALLAGAFLEGPFTITAGRALLGEPTTLGALLRAFSRRLGPYVGALVIAYFFLGLGALLFLMWIVPWVRTAYLSEASLLEQLPAVRALGRSRDLGAGVAWRTFGLLVALAAVSLGGVLVFELLGQALVGFTLQLGEPVESLFEDGGSLYALAGYLATRPLVATARFVAYIDQRTRRDGWELQIRLMDLAAARDS
jgi:hypothetical protein